MRKDEDQQRKAWKEMLDIHADQVFTIGVVNSTLQPILVSNKLQQRARRGLLQLEPGGLFRRPQARHLLVRGRVIG